MAKKTDKAVKDLAKEVKKLRKGNEKLAENLEKLYEDQAASHRELRNLLEERFAAQDAATDGPVEARQEDNEVQETSDTATDQKQEVEEESPEVTAAAQRRAEELSVDPTSVEGTGSGGRVLVKDVEASAGQ